MSLGVFLLHHKGKSWGGSGGGDGLLESLKQQLRQGFFFGRWMYWNYSRRAFLDVCMRLLDVSRNGLQHIIGS